MNFKSVEFALKIGTRAKFQQAIGIQIVNLITLFVIFFRIPYCSLMCCSAPIN